MQIIQSKQNIVVRVLRDKEGRLIRARFSVYERNGRIKAQLLDFVYVVEQALLSGVNFILSGFSKAKLSPMSDIREGGLVSIFFSKEILHFSGSKPRAPSF